MTAVKLPRREDRRDRTWRAARRAQREHLRVAHRTGPVDRVTDCLCASPLYFKKRSSLGCHCRGRRHGQPKLGRGPCSSYKIRAALVERRRWRLEAFRWMNQPGDGDDLAANYDERDQCQPRGTRS